MPKCSLVALAVFWVSTLATAATLPDSEVVTVGNTTFSDLLISPLHDQHTFVMYSAEGLVQPNSKGVVVLFPGTGAIRKKYGVAGSMTSPARSLRKMGYDILAFDNPLYYPSGEASPEVRKPYIEQYGNLEAQLTSYFRALEFAAAQLSDSQELLVFGRSTGAAMSLEAVHQYQLGNPQAAIMGRVKRVLVGGIHGHTEQDIAGWVQKEHSTVSSDLDPLVDPTSAVIFRAMGWQTHPAVGERGPEIIAILSGNDEFATLREQESPLKQFSENHSAVGVLGYYTDTRHNPAHELDYVNSSGTRVKAETMKRLKAIFRDEFVAAREILSPGYHQKEDRFFALVPNIQPCDLSSLVAP